MVAGRSGGSSSLLLAPAVTFNVVATLIGAFNTFRHRLRHDARRSRHLHAGHPETAFIQQEYAQGYYGFSISMGLLLLGLVCVVAFPALFVLRRREENL